MIEPGNPPEINRPASEILMNRVLSFATITAAGFVLGKVTGILREIVVSAHFGLSSDLDAYFVALAVPTIINNIVAGSTITAAIMPTLAQYVAKGERAEFWRVSSIVTNVVLLVAGILTVLVMLLPAPIIAVFGAGFAYETQLVATNLLVIMMPTLFLGALLNMLMAMLNSLDRFIAPALIFLALNLGIIITVIVLSPMIGVYAVAWGFLIGVALQVVIQFVELRLEHPKFHWQIDWRHPALREVFRAFIPITALSIVAQVNIVIDRAMATTLPSGSVGALYYADSVLGLFYMIGISLGIGVFPSLSRMAATNDLESTARTITTSLRLLIFILTPLTFMLIPFAVPTIGVILGRGKFDVGAVDMTANALVMYAIGLIAIAAMYVLQRAFFAFRDNITPFIVGVLTMVLHIALNWVLMQTFFHAGIALSASISTTAGAVILTLLLSWHTPKVRLSRLLYYLLQCAIVAFISVAIATWLYSILNVGTATLTARLIGIALASLGMLIYFVITLVLGLPESRMLIAVLPGFLHHSSREPRTSQALEDAHCAGDNREYIWNDAFSHRPEYPYIVSWIPDGARVIDLGCGNGTLLQILKEKKHIIESGIEISPSGVAACQKRGLNVCQGRIDAELKEIPDNVFDYAICNVTLQMVMYPEVTLREMRRIARYQIVSFPNFGFLLNRLELLFWGRMPRTMLFGYAWYDTGHIHQLSIDDFNETVSEMRMNVQDRVLLSKLGKLCVAMPNLLTQTAIFLLDKSN